MADWTTIPDTSLDPDAPARSIDAKALRDNPIAIAEGASGAPRITSASVGLLQAGDSILCRLLISTVTTASGYSSIGIGSVPDRSYSITIISSGVVRVFLQHRNTGSIVSPGSSARVLLNGSQVQSWSTTSGSFQTRQVDVSVSSGDMITVQHNASGGTNPRSELRSVQLRGSTGGVGDVYNFTAA